MRKLPLHFTPQASVNFWAQLLIFSLCKQWSVLETSITTECYSMICRWWVLKMKWGRQEPEEEMDERQEVELLRSKGIPDSSSGETGTCISN